MRPLRSLSLLLLLGGALWLGRAAAAHEFSMDAVMNAFVRVEPRELHLIVRVPLFVVRAAKVPFNGRELDLAHQDAALERVTALLARELPVWEGSRPLSPSSARARFTPPSDRSFDHYEDAAASIEAGLSPGAVIYADQGYADAHLVYPIGSPSSPFALQTLVAPELRDYLKLAVRFLPQGAPERTLLFTASAGRVSLDPSWLQAGAGFVTLGLEHILTGYDHLLFLLCLIVPVLRLRQVVPIVTAFTAGHSLTLAGAALGLGPSGAWFPPFVELAIAASIVLMALENVVSTDLLNRWLASGLFGLVHGFAFSAGMQQSLQFAGRHLAVSLLGFNLGIEAGQLLVLAAALPLLALLRRAASARTAVLLLSVLLAHQGWHWLLDRADVLSKMGWPRPDASDLGLLARWLAAGLFCAGAAEWLWSRLRAAPALRAPAAPPPE